MKSTTFKLLLIAAGATLLGAASPAILTTPPRPDADMKRDADRKPLEMIDFAKVTEGQTVVDFIPGGGYFTRLFSAAVGPKGRVIAYVPKAFADHFPAAVTALNALAAEPAHANITVTSQANAPFAAPNSADLVWTSQNYHDLHNAPGNLAKTVNVAAFAALKPGGFYVVVDHAAEAGSGLRDTNTLHRIDPAVVKSEVTGAGFVLDGESTALVNPADTHTLKVFDPALRGHTDQFVYRFRKP